MGKLIEWIIAGSIRHRIAVIAGTLILAAAGIWAFATLTTDAFPDLTPNQVIVMTTAPGLSPVEAEQALSGRERHRPRISAPSGRERAVLVAPP